MRAWKAFAGGLVLCAGCHQLAEPASPPSSPADVEGGAVFVTFRARGNDAWTLRERNGSFACQLPCSRWVPPSSGLTVQLEKHAADEDPLEFPVPDHLPARAGDALTIDVDREHGLGSASKYLAAPLAVTFGIMGAAFTGAGAAALISGRQDTSSQTSGSVSADNGAVSTSQTTESHGTAASVGAVAFGVASLAVSALCVYWYVHDRDASISFGEPRGASPSGAGVSSISAGVRF